MQSGIISKRYSVKDYLLLFHLPIPATLQLMREHQISGNYKPFNLRTDMELGHFGGFVRDEVKLAGDIDRGRVYTEGQLAEKKVLRPNSIVSIGGEKVRRYNTCVQLDWRNTENGDGDLCNERTEQFIKSPDYWESTFTPFELAEWQTMESPDLYDEEVRNSLVTRYMPEVTKIARRIYNSKLKFLVDYEDLVSEGMEGLMNGVDKYRLGLGARPGTYLFFKIRGAMLDFVRSESKKARLIHPQHIREISTMRNTAMEMTGETGIRPTDSELAENMGISIERLTEIQRRASGPRVVPIEQLRDNFKYNSSGISMLGLLADSSITEPREQLELHETFVYMDRAMARLSSNKRSVIELYYRHHWTMKKISELLELTESRVSQLHASAVKDMYSCMKKTYREDPL